VSKRTPQTYARHARYVPMYHFVLAAILLANFGWSIWRMIRWPTFGDGMTLLLAFGLLIMFGYMRVFPITVQDRVVRLEERLRMERLLPADLKARIDEFTPGQLVGLRFASDAELPDLARKVLSERITKRGDIKRLVKTWRPDDLRV
jgi:hypothetical protein